MKKYIKYIISLITLIISIIGIITILKLNILPNKYLILIIVGLFILNLLGFILLKSKKKLLNILSILLYLITITGTVIGLKYSNETLNFFKNGFSNNMEIKKYNILVLKDSNYEKLEDLNNVGYLNNIIDKLEYLDEINIEEKIEYKTIKELYEDLLNKKVQSIIVEDSYIELLESDYEDILVKAKIIYSFDITNKINIEKPKELKPINIYISGSDSRSGLVEANSRTDVNMIMTINPNTREILLTSIPRDYYVRLHGTTGYRDKLTHSGIYGINMSKQTIEDLFGIKIDYTIKVGFNSVIDVVNLIGGIDIYSDKSFYSHCGDGGAERTYINEGYNHLTGPQALSYARERYAYIEGDNHRIQNQQQVLEAIITESFKSKQVIKQYGEFLDSFKNLYRTDIPDTIIKQYIKNQLNDNKPWKIEKQVVKGTGDSNITYSMPGMYLYVMEPDMSTVYKATEKINKLLEQ